MKKMSEVKYIKFTKEHDAGIERGRVIKTNSVTAKKFIDEKYAKDATEKEYNEFKDAISKEVAKKAKAVAKETEKANKKRAEKLAPKPKEEEEETASFAEIDELDIEANPILLESGVNIGDLVLKDTEGKIVLEDGKPVVQK